ncbi:gentisate 1,2-dioxygenase [Microtetraspora sp. NBRC 13810]|uniref:cupin domain-containing protein n=1 Tax=Microtetraspora sp. NBRC 13810 TaxID=3030990 RepID=UPI00249FB30F|nr:cupin domain-containing protein [Microtetraspora sp. NBRC 13810]GLW06425.1 gentisate 1,2-dioxygenase [Microtetraspora sp. NBRC 13810]
MPGESADALDTLYRDLDAASLRPLWTITEQLLTPAPRPKAVPWLWPARTMRPLAERAIGLVPVERGGERRVLSLANPGLGGRPYAAGTLWGAIQCLGPRESAPAHRHTPGAVRFVLEGQGVWTTVDGDSCAMRPGDLILTPAWNWHDHVNEGDEPMFWFDGLDLPMIEALDGVFFEPHPDHRQPVRGRNLSEDGYAAAPGRLTPGGVDGALDPAPSPLLVYRWSDTDAELDRLAARTGEPMVTLEFTNPRSGASALPTLACAMHRLAAGRPTPPVRRSGNTVCVVHRGTGASVIAGTRFAWEPGDMFVVPSWMPVEHRAETPADLFTLSDTPVLRALGIYREETLDAAQPVTGTFEPRGETFP